MNISKQTEAEKDSYLLDCFYDSGLIDELINNSFTVISGRKGAGKSAIARYLEEKHEQYKVDYVTRLSIRNFNTQGQSNSKDILESILIYIAIKTAKKFLDQNLLKDEAKDAWNDFFRNNGLQGISDYESFIESKKISKKTMTFKAMASYLFAKGEGSAAKESQSESVRSNIAATSGNLFNLLADSISPDPSNIIFVDDVSDYLDESDQAYIRRDIGIIQDLLLRMQLFNLEFSEKGLKTRFILLVREDLFDFMEGSNTGKIKSDSLKIEWTEKDFASLLVRRMTVLQGRLNNVLEDPVKEIKTWFPDEIFTDLLKDFQTNRYGSNFYSYMAAISFNRPRDYLQFCYALRDKLSQKHPANKMNIEAAEIEYTDYLELELRNELYIASKVFDYDLSQERVHYLIRIMTKKDEFNYSELKAELNKFFANKKVGHKKVEELLNELWKYGVIGFREKEDAIIQFRYLSSNSQFTKEKIRSYKIFLHRGLWWFAKKNKIRK